MLRAPPSIGKGVMKMKAMVATIAFVVFAVFCVSSVSANGFVTAVSQAHGVQAGGVLTVGGVSVNQFPDGSFPVVSLSAGDYTAVLTGGNAGQSEVIPVRVVEGGNSGITFIGNVAATATSPTPATTEQVISARYGPADVTEQVRAVVASGVHSFHFDNARNPGGIVSESTGAVVSVIADPAYGVVKTVVIETPTGTINAEEYQVITI